MRGVPEIPVDRILQINPLCQTLSNALDIYKSIPLLQVMDSNQMIKLLMLYLKMTEKCLTTDLLHNLIIWIDIASCLFALLMLRVLTMFDMISSLKENDESQTVGTYCNELDTVLLLIRGAYFEAKKLLK